MEEVRFYLNQKLYFRFVLLGVVLALLGLTLVIYHMLAPEILTEVRHFVASTLLLSGIGVIFMFGKLALRKEPVVVLSNEGILCWVTSENSLFAPWLDVLSLKKGKFGLTYLEIKQDRRPELKKLFPLVVENEQGCTTFPLPMKTLTVSATEFEAQLRAYMKSAQDAQPPG
jgi:hypothetical protein